MVKLRPSRCSVKPAYDCPEVLLTALTINVTRNLCSLEQVSPSRAVSIAQLDSNLQSVAQLEVRWKVPKVGPAAAL
jgi:hypothetical protein